MGTRGQQAIVDRWAERRTAHLEQAVQHLVTNEGMDEAAAEDLVSAIIEGAENTQRTGR